MLSTFTAARESLRERGFAVARKLMSVEAFDEIEQIVVADLMRHGLTDGTLGVYGQPRYVPVPEGDSSAGLDLCEINRSEQVEALFHSRDVLDLVAHLLGLASVDTIFIHPIKLVRGLPPTASDLHSPAGVHQDYPELQGSTRQLTMWIPLFPVAGDSGGLPIYPINRRRLLPLILAENPSGWEVDPIYLGDSFTPRLTRGDALIFSTFTPHGGSVNRGDGWRFSVECRFQPIGDPIAETNLKPFTSTSWDLHYRGWDKYSHYWRHRQPPSVPFDHSWERWRDITALQEAQRGNLRARVGLEIASQFGTDPEIVRAADSVLREWEDMRWF
ncbi:phytanoyl-CoA dioxygenase family protein [Nocardia sp. NPDC055002]